MEIAQVFPLADAASAHALSEGGHVRGKLVLLPSTAVRAARVVLAVAARAGGGGLCEPCERCAYPSPGWNR